MKASRVWIVHHAEVVLQPDGSVVDEAVLFVASSRASALRFLRTTWVEPGTWWRVEAAPLDAPEPPPVSTLYSRAGTPLDRPPLSAGRRAALRRARRDLAWWESQAASDARRRQNIRWIRRCLAGERP